jgi:hypothetical protein
MSLEFEPPSPNWSAGSSAVLREFNRPRPSKTPEGRRAQERKRIRIGKRAIAKLTDRIAKLEQRVEELGGGSLKSESAFAPALGLEQPARKTGGSPLVDSRRPSQEELDAKADEAAARHRRLAEGYRRAAFAMNVMASRGFGARKWSSVYWNASPYRTGF